MTGILCCRNACRTDTEYRESSTGTGIMRALCTRWTSSVCRKPAYGRYPAGGGA
jgi:hypothetical protein